MRTCFIWISQLYQLTCFWHFFWPCAPRESFNTRLAGQCALNSVIFFFAGGSELFCPFCPSQHIPITFKPNHWNICSIKTHFYLHDRITRSVLIILCWNISRQNVCIRTLREVDFGVSISYSLQLMGKIILRLK
jgi:hypothetical protein